MTIDREELRDLAATYASAVDRRDRDRLLRAFHRDATLVVHRHGEADPAGHPLRGHEAIGGITEAIARWPVTFHLLGQSTHAIGLDGDGDRATGEVYCEAHHFSSDKAGEGTDHVLFIRYEDEYRRGADGRWRIALRHVRVDASDDRAIAVAPR